MPRYRASWRAPHTPTAPELRLVLPGELPCTLGTIKAETDTGLMASLTAQLRGLEHRRATLDQRMAVLRQEQQELADRLATPWEGAETYARLKHERQRLHTALSGDDATSPPGEVPSEADLEALLAESTHLTGDATPASAHTDDGVSAGTSAPAPDHADQLDVRTPLPDVPPSDPVSALVDPPPVRTPRTPRPAPVASAPTERPWWAITVCVTKRQTPQGTDEDEQIMQYTFL